MRTARSGDRPASRRDRGNASESGDAEGDRVRRRRSRREGTSASFAEEEDQKGGKATKKRSLVGIYSNCKPRKNAALGPRDDSLGTWDETNASAGEEKRADKRRQTISFGAPKIYDIEDVSDVVQAISIEENARYEANGKSSKRKDKQKSSASQQSLPAVHSSPGNIEIETDKTTPSAVPDAAKTAPIQKPVSRRTSFAEPGQESSAPKSSKKENTISKEAMVENSSSSMKTPLPKQAPGMHSRASISSENPIHRQTPTSVLLAGNGSDRVQLQQLGDERSLPGTKSSLPQHVSDPRHNREAPSQQCNVPPDFSKSVGGGSQNLGYTNSEARVSNAPWIGDGNNPRNVDTGCRGPCVRGAPGGERKYDDDYRPYYYEELGGRDNREYARSMAWRRARLNKEIDEQYFQEATTRLEYLLRDCQDELFRLRSRAQSRTGPCENWMFRTTLPWHTSPSVDEWELFCRWRSQSNHRTIVPCAQSESSRQTPMSSPIQEDTSRYGFGPCSELHNAERSLQESVGDKEHFISSGFPSGNVQDAPGPSFPVGPGNVVGHGGVDRDLSLGVIASSNHEAVPVPATSVSQGSDTRAIGTSEPTREIHWDNVGAETNDRSNSTNCRQETRKLGESSDLFDVQPVEDENGGGRGRGRAGSRKRPAKRDQTPFNPRFQYVSDEDDDDDGPSSQKNGVCFDAPAETDGRRESSLEQERGRNMRRKPSKRDQTPFNPKILDQGNLSADDKHSDKEISSKEEMDTAVNFSNAEVGMCPNSSEEESGRGRGAVRRKPSKRDQTPFNPKILAQMYEGSDSEGSESSLVPSHGIHFEKEPHCGGITDGDQRGRSEIRRKPSKRDQTPFNPKIFADAHDDDEGSDTTNPIDTSAQNDGSGSQFEPGRRGRPTFSLPEADDMNEGPANGDRHGKGRPALRSSGGVSKDGSGSEEGRGRGEVRRKPSKRDQTPFNPRILSTYSYDDEDDDDGQGTLENDSRNAESFEASQYKSKISEPGCGPDISRRVSWDKSTCTHIPSEPKKSGGECEAGLSRKVSWGDGSAEELPSTSREPRGRELGRRKPGKRDQTPFNPKGIVFGDSEDESDNTRDAGTEGERGDARKGVTLSDPKNRSDSEGEDISKSRGRAECRRRPSKRDQTPFNPRILSQSFSDEDEDMDTSSGSDTEKNDQATGRENSKMMNRIPEKASDQSLGDRKDRGRGRGRVAFGGPGSRSRSPSSSNDAEIPPSSPRARFGESEKSQSKEGDMVGEQSESIGRGRASMRRKPSKRDQTPFNPKMFMMPSASSEEENESAEEARKGERQSGLRFGPGTSLERGTSSDWEKQENGGEAEDVISFRPSSRGGRQSFGPSEDFANNGESMASETRRGRDETRRKPGKRDQTPFNPKLFKDVSDESSASSSSGDEGSGGQEPSHDRSRVRIAPIAAEGDAQSNPKPGSKPSRVSKLSGASSSGSKIKFSDGDSEMAKDGIASEEQSNNGDDCDERPRGREESRPELHKVLSNSKRASTREQTPFYISRQLSNPSEVEEEYTDICRRRSHRRESRLPDIAEDENSPTLPCFIEDDDVLQDNAASNEASSSTKMKDDSILGVGGASLGAKSERGGASSKASEETNVEVEAKEGVGKGQKRVVVQFEESSAAPSDAPATNWGEYEATKEEESKIPASTSCPSAQKEAQGKEDVESGTVGVMKCAEGAESQVPTADGGPNIPECQQYGEDKAVISFRPQANTESIGGDEAGDGVGLRTDLADSSGAGEADAAPKMQKPVSSTESMPAITATGGNEPRGTDMNVASGSNTGSGGEGQGPTVSGTMGGVEISGNGDGSGVVGKLSQMLFRTSSVKSDMEENAATTGGV